MPGEGGLECDYEVEIEIHTAKHMVRGYIVE